MSAQLPSPDRRKVLAASVAVAASGFLPTQAQAATANEAIRPFKVSFPEDELDELRKRIKATRWPERETVSDDSQGVPLAMIQELARYWATDYDWRKCETKLNAPCLNSSPRSMASTFISFTFVLNTKMPCR